MAHKKIEGESYLPEKQRLDAELISPQEKTKKQQDDNAQNNEENLIPDNSSTNTRLGQGNTMEDGSKAPHPKK